MGLQQIEIDEAFNPFLSDKAIYHDPSSLSFGGDDHVEALMNVFSLNTNVIAPFEINIDLRDYETNRLESITPFNPQMANRFRDEDYYLDSRIYRIRRNQNKLIARDSLYLKSPRFKYRLRTGVHESAYELTEKGLAVPTQIDPEEHPWRSFFIATPEFRQVLSQLRLIVSVGRVSLMSHAVLGSLEAQGEDLIHANFEYFYPIDRGPLPTPRPEFLGTNSFAYYTRIGETHLNPGLFVQMGLNSRELEQVKCKFIWNHSSANSNEELS